MKPVISLPDKLFAEAERLARRLRKSRSELYRQAVAELIARHDPDEITAAMDRVAERLDTRADAFTKTAARRVLSRMKLDASHHRWHNDVVIRTTVMADSEVLAKLRALAKQRGVSLAEVTREALAAKAAQYRPAPTCLGIGDSGRRDVSSKAGVGRTPSR